MSIKAAAPQWVSMSIEPETPQLTAVGRILAQINDLLAGLSALEGITERLAGDCNGANSNGPTPVPSGAIEQIEDGLRGLQNRLDAALLRLRPIA